MAKFRRLVNEGIYDKQSKTQIQIRVIACLGTVVIVRSLRLLCIMYTFSHSFSTSILEW